MSLSQVPIQVEVADLALPAQTDLAVYTWWRGIHSSDAQWGELVDQGINTFGFIVSGALSYTLDAKGEIVGKVGFHPDLARLARAQTRSGGSLLIEWYFRPGAPIARSTSSDEDFKYMTPPWKKAFTTLMQSIHQHLESQGVPREKLLHYLFDETIGDHFIETAKFIRGVDPSYRIFNNGNGDLDGYKRVAPYVDVWCLHVMNLQATANDGRLEFLRSTGKPIWSYDEGYHQRGKPPYHTYRRRFWQAVQYDLQGVGNWKHHGLVGMTYKPNYGTRVTSRRYEAWMSGAEDHKLLTLLNTVAESEGTQAGAAKALLTEAVREVSRSGDTKSADRYRHRMIRLLAGLP